MDRLLVHVLDIVAINGLVRFVYCKMILKAIQTILAIKYMHGCKPRKKARTRDSS